MKKKLERFFQTELSYLKVGLVNENDLIQRSDMCWYALQRGLGAVTFAQMCGMRYEDAEMMYNEYKSILDDLV